MMKFRRCLYGAVFYVGIFLLFSCENDLRKIEQDKKLATANDVKKMKKAELLALLVE